MATKFLTRDDLNEISEKLKEEEQLRRLLKQEVVMQEERTIKLEREIERLNKVVVRQQEIIQAHESALVKEVI